MGRRHGSGVNIAHHNDMKKTPTRERFLLWEAAKDSGYKIVGLEYALEAPWGPVWYDVVFDLGDTLGLVFLYKPTHEGRKNIQARTRKIVFAKNNGYPFLEIWPTSQIGYRAQIELWLATRRARPYVEAQGYPAWLDKEGRDYRKKKDFRYI